MANETKHIGMLKDHTGKGSISRGTTMLGTITLCAIALGQTFYDGAVSADPALLIALSTLALGPIAANRAWGEAKE